jgi:hypothetical protein
MLYRHMDIHFFSKIHSHLAVPILLLVSIILFPFILDTFWFITLTNYQRLSFSLKRIHFIRSDLLNILLMKNDTLEDQTTFISLSKCSKGNPAGLAFFDHSCEHPSFTCTNQSC